MLRVAASLKGARGESSTCCCYDSQLQHSSSHNTPYLFAYSCFACSHFAYFKLHIIYFLHCQQSCSQEKLFLKTSLVLRPLQRSSKGVESNILFLVYTLQSHHSKWKSYHGHQQLLRNLHGCSPNAKLREAKGESCANKQLHCSSVGTFCIVPLLVNANVSVLLKLV